MCSMKWIGAGRGAVEGVGAGAVCSVECAVCSVQCAIKIKEFKQDESNYNFILKIKLSKNNTLVYFFVSLRLYIFKNLKLDNTI